MQVTLQLDRAAALFYMKLAKVSGLPIEQVLTDALFKLAGELSLEAIQKCENTL